MVAGTGVVDAAGRGMQRGALQLHMWQASLKPPPLIGMVVHRMLIHVVDDGILHGMTA